MTQQLWQRRKFPHAHATRLVNSPQKCRDSITIVSFLSACILHRPRRPGAWPADQAKSNQCSCGPVADLLRDELSRSDAANIKRHLAPSKPTQTAWVNGLGHEHSVVFCFTNLGTNQSCSIHLRILRETIACLRTVCDRHPA